MQRKHVMGVALIVALMISSVGLLSVNAQEDETAWLGVGIDDTDAGVLVVEVAPFSPADEAGIERGDVIEAVGRTRITSAEQLVDLIQSFDPGDEILIVVVRDGEELEKAVVLGERPDDLVPPGVIIEVDPPMHGEMVLMGMVLLMSDDGIMVEAIDEDSPLADAGFEPGDLIIAINGEPVEELMPYMMLDLLAGEEVIFTVLRDDDEIEIAVDIAGLDHPEFGYHHAPYEMGIVDVRQPLQLGVRFMTLTPEIVDEEELPIDEGALLIEVYEDTPAADAGLEAGDIIAAVDGDMVDEEHTLPDRLYAYEQDDEVTLTVVRDNAELTLTVTLGPNPRDMRMGAPMPMLPGMPFAPGMQGEGPFFVGPGMFYFIPMPEDGRFEFGPGMMMPFGGEHDFGFGFEPGHEGRFRDHMDGGGGMFFGMPGEWFELHPFMGEFMGEWFEMMPFHEDGEFHFHFGAPDDMPDAGGDMMEDGAMEIVPEADGASA